MSEGTGRVFDPGPRAEPTEQVDEEKKSERSTP